MIEKNDWGLMQLREKPTKESIDHLYNDDNFYKDPAWFKKEVEEHQAGLWDSAYKWQARELGEFPLIDIGAGTGEFVKWWNRWVNYASGTEPSEQCRRREYRLAIDQSEWNRSSLWIPFQGKSGIARFSLVLEHVYDPVSFLQANIQGWRAFTVKKVLIVVPNEFNPLQAKLVKRDGKQWFLSRDHIIPVLTTARQL